MFKMKKKWNNTYACKDPKVFFICVNVIKITWNGTVACLWSKMSKFQIGCLLCKNTSTPLTTYLHILIIVGDYKWDTVWSFNSLESRNQSQNPKEGHEGTQTGPEFTFFSFLI